MVSKKKKKDLVVQLLLEYENESEEDEDLALISRKLKEFKEKSCHQRVLKRMKKRERKRRESKCNAMSARSMDT